MFSLIWGCVSSIRWSWLGVGVSLPTGTADPVSPQPLVKMLEGVVDPTGSG